MKIAKRAIDNVKSMPKMAWLAAIVVPGGFAAIGIWITVKTVMKRKKND